MNRIFQRSTAVFFFAVSCHCCIGESAISGHNDGWTDMMHSLCVNVGSNGTDVLVQAVCNIADCYPDQSASFSNLNKMSLSEWADTDVPMLGKKSLASLID